MKTNSLSIMVLLFLGSTALLSAQDYEINREELQRTSDQNIEFVNYLGPHEAAQLSTAQEIRDIGRITARRGDYYGAYRVIRAADDSLDGMDADIFIIEASATVDHIRNVRGMLSGYLQEAYGLEESRGDTLAHFVTVYNAVYRGDLTAFSQRFKPVVMGHLSSENAGIALRYSEWPGKTRMVIPLRNDALRGELEKVDTGELSTDEVIEKMQEEDDRSVEVRKEMVEIREDEQQREREALEQVETKTAEETAAEADDSETTAVVEKKQVTESPDPSRETDESVEEKQETTPAEPEKEKTVEPTSEEIVQRREQLEEEEQEVREERREIAKDENEVIQEEKEEEKAVRQAQIQNPSVKPFYFLSLRQEGSDILGQIVMADENSRKVLFRSDVNSIRGREFLISPEGIMAVAGQTSGAAAVRAVILDEETLQVVKEGTDTLHPESGLWFNDGSYYMVVDEGGQWVLGRFNSQLVRQRASSLAVLPYTALVFENEGLYVQSSRGSIVKLNASTLETETAIE